MIARNKANPGRRAPATASIVSIGFDRNGCAPGGVGRRRGAKELLAAAVIALALFASPAIAADKPRLVLQITVDQLRGDLPLRYLDRLGEGGLRYLVEDGVYYRNAHHAHANTETIVGHVTLATGAHPAAHGMVGNLWFDRVDGRVVYNIEDPEYRLLTEGAGVDSDTEIDPTQRAAKSDGRSPRAILTSTFSDELASLTEGRAKIFAISVKDRGAVSMAGHAGKAFWFSKTDGNFVTSNFYYDRYPQWVNDWNARELAKGYAGKSWELMHPVETYLFGERDDQPWETDLSGYGRTFPHAFQGPDNRFFTTYLTISPAGDELTADFATALIAAEGLGDDEITDYLAISFSSTDYVGHMFGPSSLESEDNILRLDRTLAGLFAFIDSEIGLENTLIVLAADHGAPEAPGYLESLGIPTGLVSPDSWDREAAITRLKQRFGIEGELVETYSHPYLYLASNLLDDPEINLAELETAVAEELVAFDDVAYAIPSTAIARGTLPNNALTRAIHNNYNPARSGNIYVVFKPGRFINDMDGLSATVTHGSLWRYDTYVPIIFAGYGLEARTVRRRVHTVDIALTLSNLVGTLPPSGAAGEVLIEIFEPGRNP
jgi:predicted AlkP superfamily pyrophosphatase or phosphodiesterase